MNPLLSNSCILIQNSAHSLQSLAESPWSKSFVQKNDTVDADQVLIEFKDWVTNNRDRLPRHDHAMAFTR